VSQCAITGSLQKAGARNPGALDPPAAGSLTFTGSGTNAGVLLNVVLVGTYDAAGALQDRDFSIHADC
jgi:hypothetical protein